MPQVLNRPATVDQTPILRAFVTLMNNDDQETLEARLALEVLAVAAREGAIAGVVKLVAADA